MVKERQVLINQDAKFDDRLGVTERMRGTKDVQEVVEMLKISKQKKGEYQLPLNPKQLAFRFRRSKALKVPVPKIPEEPRRVKMQKLTVDMTQKAH